MEWKTRGAKVTLAKGIAEEGLPSHKLRSMSRLHTPGPSTWARLQLNSTLRAGFHVGCVVAATVDAQSMAAKMLRLVATHYALPAVAGVNVGRVAWDATLLQLGVHLV